MSNALSVPDFTQLPVLSTGGADAFAESTKRGNWLRSLKIYSLNSGAVAQGLIRGGHFGVNLGDDDVLDLGPEIDVYPIARRMQAINFTGSPPDKFYDENSADFKAVKAGAAQKIPNNPNQWGPSFLVIERESGQFFEWVLGAATHRPEGKYVDEARPLSQAELDARRAAATAAGDAKALADLADVVPHNGYPIRVQTRLVERGSNRWYVPVVTSTREPFLKMPPLAAVMEEIEKFLNPPAPEPAQPQTRRR